MKGDGSFKASEEGSILGKTLERAKQSGRITSGNLLGWLSLGLGFAALAGSKRILNWLRLGGNTRALWTLRAIGVREVVTGLGILSQAQQPRWLWSRVAGDAIDLGLLGYLGTGKQPLKERAQIGLSAVTAVAALDLASALMARRAQRTFHVHKIVTINRSPQQIYRFWRNLQNLPRFMEHLKAVEPSDGGRLSHWVADAPAGSSVEWDAEIVEEVPGSLIAWRSLEGSQVDHNGVVRFEPGPHGTVVRVELDYRPPAGALGVALAKLSGKSPDQQVESDLHHLKQVLETGEIPTTKGQPFGHS